MSWGKIKLAGKSWARKNALKVQIRWRKKKCSDFFSSFRGELFKGNCILGKTNLIGGKIWFERKIILVKKGCCGICKEKPLQGKHCVMVKISCCKLSGVLTLIFGWFLEDLGSEWINAKCHLRFWNDDKCKQLMTTTAKASRALLFQSLSQFND